MDRGIFALLRDPDLSARYPSLALVRRELIAQLRRGRSFLYLFSFFLIALIYLYQVYPTEMIHQDEVASQSNRLMLAVAAMFFGAGFLFIPGLAGASISGERESQIYDQLHLSLISPSGIFFAKTINVTGFFLILTVAALPAAGIVFFMVGVDEGQFISHFVSLGAMALSSAALGVLCSALSQRTTVAVVASYFLVAIVQLFGFTAFRWIMSIGPRLLESAWSLPERFFIFFNPGMDVLYAAMVIVLAHLIAKSALAKPPVSAEGPPPSDFLPRPPRAPRSSRYLQFLTELIDRDQAIKDQLNPVFVKELRMGMDGGQMVAMVLMFYLGFVIYASTAFGYLLDAIIKDRSAAESLGPPALVHICFAVFCAPSILANSLTKEGELGNVDMLRMTLVTNWRMVWGKMLSGLTMMTPLLLASVFTLGPLGLLAHFSLDGLSSTVAVILTLFLCVFLSLSLSLLAGAVAQHTITAVLYSYGLNVLVFAGGVMLMVVANDMRLFGFEPGEIAFASPLVAFYSNFHDAPRDSLFTGYWLANFILFGLIAAGAFALSGRAFVWTRMRRNQ